MHSYNSGAVTNVRDDKLPVSRKPGVVSIFFQTLYTVVSGFQDIIQHSRVAYIVRSYQAEGTVVVIDISVWVKTSSPVRRNWSVAYKNKYSVKIGGRDYENHLV